MKRRPLRSIFRRGGGHVFAIRDINFSAPAPETRTTFVFDAWPLLISTSRAGTPNSFDRNFISASLAAPSTGGAATRTRSAPSCSPAASVFDARGTTRTEKLIAPSSSLYLITRLHARGFVRDRRLNTNHRDRDRPLQEVEQEKYDDGRDVEHTDRRDDAAEGAEHRLRRPYEEVQRGAVRACHPRHDEAREDEERVKGEAAEQDVANERDRRAAYHALEQSLYDEEYSPD